MATSSSNYLACFLVLYLAHKMLTITSLPTEITTKILRAYVSFYLIPSLDSTRVPANDSSALEFRCSTERLELLAMLSVSQSFAVVLPGLIFQRINIFSASALSLRSFITGHFAEALTFIEKM
ncbi:hypothetical protein BDP27DRAFT_1341161 [Rhodocollybia butyracea]|uniref:Uncharacterized protein n=1 Tax=Rhodocollybia butyracea TaxID=206335 RepID=A0A9P5PC89_9AGAR|nr:hypothetical protein BDP27DRAFT_1341161 [Rhodocollybia butyracea]